MEQKLNYYKIEINDKNKNKQKYRKRNIENFKIKDSNKIRTEINSSNILSPSIDISNKNNYIYEKLKNDYTYSRQNRYLKRINYTKDKNYKNNFTLNNNINEDIILVKPKIKVKINSIYSSNKPIPSTDKLSKTIHFKQHKISPRNKNNKSMIFNYSCIDNRVNTLIKNKKKALNSAHNSFELNEINNSEKNKNKYGVTTDKNVNNISNKYEYTMNNSINYNKNIINNKDIKTNKNLYENKKFNKNKFRENFRNIEVFDNISNLKLNNINNKKLYSKDENDNERKEIYLTQKLCKYSNSLKLIGNNIPENSKLNVGKKDINSRNENIKNSKYKLNFVLSPSYNYIKNTYQKKLVKRNSIREENNIVNNKTFKLEYLNNTDDFKYKNDIQKNSQKRNSPIKISKSSSFTIYKLINNRLTEIDSNINNKIKYRLNLCENIDKKYKHKYSNSILTPNNNKEDTKCPSEQISDNNYSTNTNTFYYNKSNNSLMGQKKISHDNSEPKLKNIITKIDYRNKNTNSKTELFNEIKLNKNNKNVVLYEIDRNGKINYKIKEMKNSVEKIVKESSLSRNKKRSSKEFSPKNNEDPGYSSIYVKKNQGTILRRKKMMKKLEFFWQNSNYASNKIT